MSTVQGAAAAGETPVTPEYAELSASHINTLSTINKRTPEVLRKSATAISLLTNNPVARARSDDPADPQAASPPVPDNLENRKALIQEISEAFFVQVNSIRTQLKNEVSELESQKVIPAAAARAASTSIPKLPGMEHLPDEDKSAIKQSETNVTNGGLGNLDIAELNARAAVRQQGGDEILDRVQSILEEMVRKTQLNDGSAILNDG